MTPKALFIAWSSLAIIAASAIGGVLSRQIDKGEWPWWTAIFSAALSGMVWGLMCRYTQSLVLASLLYDVVATLTYTAVFLVGGERLTPIQSVGVVLALIGVGMVGSSK